MFNTLTLVFYIQHTDLEDVELSGTVTVMRSIQ